MSMARKGKQNGNSKLTEKDVKEIKELLKVNAPVELIAKDFNISLYSIWDIKRGRTWRHIKIE